MYMAQAANSSGILGVQVFFIIGKTVSILILFYTFSGYSLLLRDIYFQAQIYEYSSRTSCTKRLLC